MTAYTAKFSTGETKSIANSSREYVAAWLIEARDTTGACSNVIKIGFARDHGMAHAAAAREFAAMNSVASWKRHRPEFAEKRWALIRSEVVSVERS